MIALGCSGHIVRGVLYALALSSFTFPAIAITVAENSQYVNVGTVTNWNGKLNLPAQATKHVLVNIDLKRLQLPATTHINFLLPDGKAVPISKTRQEYVGKHGFIWHGKVDGDDKSIVTFSIVNDVLVGDILTSKGKMYRVEHVTAGVQLIAELSPARFLPETRKRAPIKSKALLKSAVSCPTDSTDRIDLMVLYTEAACAAANNAIPCTAASHFDAMEAKINEAVSEANESYMNSFVNQRLSLVHIGSVDAYVEASFLEGHLYKDLERLTLVGSDETFMTGDVAYLDIVHDLRDRYAADVVVLITKPTKDYANCNCPNDSGCPSCGVSPPNTLESAASSNQAFAVVPLDCATGNLSFAHELGHIMGANHDEETSPEDMPFTYSHGYIKANPTGGIVPPWRTIMAYNTDACIAANSEVRPEDIACNLKQGCVRIPYWSNPAATHGGDTMGHLVDADNHQALNDTADTVANYRLSSICGKDVWMKDTWQDSGLEPDPAQADKPMYKSPYIWVRNSLDPDQGWLHQHEHENPEFGSTNWAYVKLHNGGPTTSGHLELRYSKASSGLIWEDSSWIVIGSEEVTISGNSTRIVPFQWDDIPEPGHYCLIAKWISPDDPIDVSGETKLGPIVRANNNVVWRNANIVDLIEEATVTSELSVANPTDTSMATSIEILTTSTIGQSFLSFGEISIELDQALQMAWTKGGSKSYGMKVGETLQLISMKGASLDGLSLAPGFRGKLKITISRRNAKSYPRGIFGVDVTQSHIVKGKKEIFGGVSYEIRTHKQ